MKDQEYDLILQLVKHQVVIITYRQKGILSSMVQAVRTLVDIATTAEQLIDELVIANPTTHDSASTDTRMLSKS